jgi:hypothetical protein
VPSAARGSTPPWRSSHSYFVPEKYCVEHEPGALAEHPLVPGGAQLVAAARGPAVLPHDRPVQRAAGLAIPRDRRLALVRDPDPGEVLPTDAGVVERLLGDAARDVPDLLRVVLDPAGPREVLAEFGVRAPARPPVSVEHEACRAGRPLVDAQDHGGAAYAVGR